MIVSGGDQEELRALFAERGLTDFFDSGIYGSPKPKDWIVADLLAKGVVEAPALLIGDSRFDYEIAASNGFDFVFVHGWTEFSDWQSFFADKRVTVIERLGDLQ